MPPEISRWLSERLDQLPAFADQLPPPTKVEEKTLKNVAPTLKVTICVAEGQVGFRHGAPLPRWVRVGAGVVSFDYAGIDVPPEEKNTSQGYRDGQRLTVQRDIEAERALVRKLPSGMVTLEQLMLRRTKQQVLAELPQITETRREVTLTGTQRELYESLRLAQHQRVQQAVAERGLASSGIVMLDALLKLRQVCCDPRLVKLDSARKVKRSAKLDQLQTLLPPLIEEGRRILVFSQFTEMLELISQALEKAGITYTSLTGDTPGKVRTQRVAAFQQGEIPVFLISLKAGGTGLNLTAADTVIHYAPWWNPAVEAQATGRAHRMGQQNPVFVYKLICAGTVEERIHDLQVRKADLAASILEGGAERQSDGPLFEEEDLELLFAPIA